MLDGFIVVYRAAGLTEAELVKGYLESEEIPVDLDYESAGAVIGLTMDGLGEVRVIVPSQYAEEARRALAVRPVTRDEDTWGDPDATAPTAGEEEAAREAADQEAEGGDSSNNHGRSVGDDRPGADK